MREDVKLQLLQLLRVNGGLRSRIVVQKEVRFGSAASLIPDVVLKLIARVNVPVGVQLRQVSALKIARLITPTFYKFQPKFLSTAL